MNDFIWIALAVVVLFIMFKTFKWILDGNNKSSYSEDVWERIHRNLMEVGEKNR